MANQTARLRSCWLPCGQGNVDYRHQGSYPGTRSQDSPGPDFFPEVGEASNQASENPPGTRLAVVDSESVRHGMGKVITVAVDTGHLHV